MLDNYLFVNKLYSIFKTAGVLLTAFYELLGNVIMCKATLGRKQDIATNNIVNYGVMALQRAELLRK